MSGRNQNQNVGKNPKSEHWKKGKVMQLKKTTGKILIVLIGCFGAAWSLEAQQLAAEGDLVRPSGLKIYSISGAIGYSELPKFQTASGSFQSLPSRTSAWSTMVAGYALTSSRTRFGLTYAPSYNGRIGSGGRQSFNQNLVLDLTREITPKVFFQLSGNGDDSTFDQLVIQPGGFSLLAGSQPSFDQLAAAAASGLVSGGSPALGAAYYGTRNLTFSGHAGLTYRQSSRLTFDFRGGVTQTQISPVGNKNTQTLLGRTMSDQAEAVVSYSLTPSSRVGVQANVMNIRSTLADYRIVTGTGFYTHNFGKRWFATVNGGTSSLENTGRIRVPTGVGYVGSGSVGATYNRHTLIATYGRTLGDPYGFGSRSSQQALGAWNWNKRGMTWGLQASFGQQTMNSSSLGDITAWQSSAGITRALNRQIQVSAGYAFLKNSMLGSQSFLGTPRHVVQFGIIWSPMASQLQHLQIGSTP